ncbi:chromate transporter [Anaeromyxobacter diazotrophicus]|uniref:Chromate transporter n=1 Tax=Anaeromyxobacter diazotrophicus TaxID=2590199 RepID=A0A7I9VMR9_9BACT|nr:chromate transporter [Anaeromyxobacter diazotrophicus]GEJ57429.1 chromate transporter [Anaeromyxobacter diazotrophicus]
MSTLGWAVLLGQVLLLSLLQVGGALAIAPDLHRLVVGRLALLDDAQFASSIAIAQAAPGPNTLYVALLGFQAAGLAGAVCAQLAVLAPSSMLAVAVGRWGHARQHHRAVLAFKAGMAPVTIALLAATSWIIASELPGWRPIALAAAAALAVWRTRLHILWLMALGALAGALGWV